MEKGDVLIALIASVPGLIGAGMSLYLALKKSPSDIALTQAETKKAEAEADNIHAQVADRWAEHVTELTGKVEALTLDVSQVRRENEKYRHDLDERDQVISDLKDWASRLLKQLREHAPHVKPAQYIARPVKSQKIYDTATGNGS